MTAAALKSDRTARPLSGEPDAVALDPYAARFLTMIAAGRATSPNIADRRESLRQLAKLGDWGVAGVDTRDFEIAGPDGTIPARLYEPSLSDGGLLPGLVYVHGGGLVAGGLDTHDGVCRQLCAASGSRIVAVDYRLAPEHRFPAGLDDVLAAFGWVARHAGDLGIDAERLAIGGDSAGAGLAAMACHVLRGSELAIAAQLLICPVLDIERDTVSRTLYAKGYFLDLETIRSDAVALGFAAGAPLSCSPLDMTDLDGLPPAIVHTAAFDIVRDDGTAFAERLREAGVAAKLTCHEGMIHYFYALGRLIPRSRPILETIGGELAHALRVRATAPLELVF